MTELKDIINYVVQSYLDVPRFRPSDDMILDCAVRIYNSQSFKETKSSVNQVKEKSDLPKASDKQIAYLVQLGYEGSTELNIQEAKELITALKEQRRKERNEQRR